MILENAEKYSISAMSRVLKISRSTLYYKEKAKADETALEKAVVKEFYASRENYGRRKLKVVLSRQKMVVSPRKISKIMKKYGLVSKYTIRNTKKKSSASNNDEVGNIVNREFDGREKYEVVVSDLTYIKIGGKWRYLCLLLRLVRAPDTGQRGGQPKRRETRGNSVLLGAG